MLQNNQTLLQQKLTEDFIPDSKIVDHMVKMGFHPEIVNMSLRQAVNNMDEAVDMLLRMQGNGTYDNLLTSICGAVSGNISAPSTSEDQSIIAPGNSSITSPGASSSASSAFATAVENIRKTNIENEEAMAVSFF